MALIQVSEILQFNTHTHIYILACLSTMFLGYRFRHCFAIFVPFLLGMFVPLSGDFLSLSLGNYCP